MPIAKTAFIDESLRVRDGLYLLAPVIVADDDTEHHRQALRTLLYRGQRRLHWRDESANRRDQIIGAVRSGSHRHRDEAQAARTRPAQMHRASPGGTDWAGHR